MDLSLRVYLRGWRSLYLHDVCCPNELPSTLSAYKTQQFRWLSGPMQVRPSRTEGPGFGGSGPACGVGGCAVRRAGPAGSCPRVIPRAQDLDP